MMNKIKFQHLVLIIGLGLFVSFMSCKKSDLDLSNISDEIELNPTIAIPLAYGNMSLDDVLNIVNNDSIVKQYDDSLLYIIFSDTLINIAAKDAIEEIPDQGFIEEYIESEITINPIWIASNVGDTVNFHKDKEEEWTFNNGERIDSILIKALDLTIDVTSSFKHTGILDISSENFTIDGDPFSEEILISDLSGNFSDSKTIKLDNHWMYLDNSTPGVTRIPLNYDLKLINSGNPVIAGESCHITMTFSGLEFSSIFGYVGDYDLANIDEDTISFDFFDNESLNGELYLANPQFNLNIENSIGVPIGIDLSSLTSYSASKDQTISFTLNENPYTIAAPGLDSVGYFKRTEISIDSSNSNISDILASFPSRIIYTVGASTNPGGATTNNFVTDSSELHADFEAVIPIYLRASGFSLEDTIEFDIQDQFGDEIDFIQLLEFTLDITNGLPLNVDMQMFFVDSVYNELDSMFIDDAFLIAPSLNASDEVDSPNEYTKVISFDFDKVQKIKTTKNILMRARLSTSEATAGKTVKFFSYYDIDFKLKMRADMKINSKDIN